MAEKFTSKRTNKRKESSGKGGIVSKGGGHRRGLQKNRMKHRSGAGGDSWSIKNQIPKRKKELSQKHHMCKRQGGKGDRQLRETYHWRGFIYKKVVPVLKGSEKESDRDGQREFRTTRKESTSE